MKPIARTGVTKARRRANVPVAGVEAGVLQRASEGRARLQLTPDGVRSLGVVVGDRLLCELDDELFGVDVRAVHAACIDVVGFSPLTEADPERVKLRSPEARAAPTSPIHPTTGPRSRLGSRSD